MGKKKEIDPLFKPRPRCQFVKETPAKYVNLSQLFRDAGEDQKQRLWARLKQKHPDLAALLKESPAIEISEYFNADIFVVKK